MSAGKVDVLAVMASVIEESDSEGRHLLGLDLHDRLVEARAAVAELIEADKEFDEAARDWERLTGGELDALLDCPDERYRQIADRYEAAVMRRIAALVRVGGAP